MTTLKELSKIVASLGGTLWLVGGAVRDSLQGVAAHDRDYMITGCNPDSLPFDKIAGSDFPVFLVEVDGEKVEVALARSEKKAGVGYHGFTFSANKDVTVEQDLSRRDLTINSMAINVATGELVDPFGGVDDLRARVIRHTSLAFSEDPTRVYRVARFAARFGFAVAPETMALIRSMKAELSEITAERVGKELIKALDTPTPSVFFRVLKEAGLLDVHFAAVGALNVPDKHDGTAFNHTMTVMDAGSSVLDRLALLCHDFGKGLTPKDQHPRHLHHDFLGVSVVEQFCDSLRLSRAAKQFAVGACRTHMKIKKIMEMRPATLISFVAAYPNILDLLRISEIDSVARDGATQDDVVLHGEILKRVQAAMGIINAITGKTLIAQGVVPSTSMGNKIHAARVAAAKAAWV
ncbi:MAG: multifunctional CCA tRNA nucleotidyl transferase/2'3'-cyclic phosphodiesterase/2'nucleotidase/phosphatase [Clostridia bacterium]|nr:multifunctional CCA tRNA nucleotidyl transferase/2'3'-cyclic phosphodiesterase/2'nucleotidase/phosphatase [Clostridia bacterium]